MKFFLLIQLVCCCILTTSGQVRCITKEYWHQQLTHDPALRMRFEQMEQSDKRQSAIPKKKQDSKIAELPLIRIPVVIHVLYNTAEQNISDEQIKSQINILNNDFGKKNNDTTLIPAAFAPLSSDCRIQFALATSDPTGRTTNGIVRIKTNRSTWNQDDQMKFSVSGGSDAWDSRSYLNIWVCNLTKTILGYSTFPGAAPEKDGVVIRTDVFGINRNNHTTYNKGRTTTHEVGHWLNLKHLWGDTDCGDDGVADTPPQKTYNSGCPSFPQISAKSCNPLSTGDMFMNFMDFTDDGCMHMFTAGQKERIHRLFEPSGARESLVYSKGLHIVSEQTAPSASNTDGNFKLILSPNPANAYTTLRLSNQTLPQGCTYSIYDLTGRPVIQAQLTGNTISTKQLPSGIYLLKLRMGGQLLVTKLVKD